MAVPQLTGIDHVHVYVSDRDVGQHWYESVLGLKPVERLRIWAADGGPLVLENADGTVDIALFEADRHSLLTEVSSNAISVHKLLTDEIQKDIKSDLEKKDNLKVARLIADYVAGMTDRFAFSEYERINSNNA